MVKVGIVLVAKVFIFVCLDEVGAEDVRLGSIIEAIVLVVVDREDRSVYTLVVILMLLLVVVEVVVVEVHIVE